VDTFALLAAWTWPILLHLTTFAHRDIIVPWVPLCLLYVMQAHINHIKDKQNAWNAPLDSFVILALGLTVLSHHMNVWRAIFVPLEQASVSFLALLALLAIVPDLV
jgi:hypothetical protein